MARSFYWVCKNEEVKVIENWIENNGGKMIEMNPTSNAYIIYFNNLGPIHYVDKASLELNENQTWREKKTVILNKIHLEKNLDVNLIDTDQSPVASYIKPFLKDSTFWTTGELHFLPSKLKERWPDLNSICTSFERWISKQELIFDNTKKDIVNDYGYYIGGDLGIVRKIFAFPNAIDGLKNGEYFLDSSISDFNYEKWLKTLRHRGVSTPDFA